MTKKWLPRDQWLALYGEYLRSPQWAELRRRVFVRDGGRCQFCGERATQVHHLTYKRFQNEKLFDLVSICDACHSDEHGRGSKLEAVRVVDCWRCGAQHDILAGTAYLAWWLRLPPHEDDLASAETGAIYEAGIFCNGRGKCRDIVHAELGAKEPRGFAHLRDQPTDSFAGEWGWMQFSNMLRYDRWESAALSKMLMAIRLLTTCPSDDPPTDARWHDPQFARVVDSEED